MFIDFGQIITIEAYWALLWNLTKAKGLHLKPMFWLGILSQGADGDNFYAV